MLRSATDNEQLRQHRHESHIPSDVPDAVNIRSLPIQSCPLNVLSAGQIFQWRNPGPVEWSCAAVPIPGLPAALRGLRIVQLTDLHFRLHWHAGHDQLLQTLRDRRPDLILITGDFVDSKRLPPAAVAFACRFVEQVDQLRAPLGLFGIFGNHDDDRLLAPLSEAGVQILDGHRTLIHHNGAALELIGIPGPYRKHLTQAFVETLPQKSPQTPRLILGHYPDHLPKLLPLEPDLYFAGHTHGGQCCLPAQSALRRRRPGQTIGIPIIRHDSLPPRLCSGLHRVGSTWLCIPRGIGFSGLPMRLFCPSQVIELELQ